MLQTLPTSNGSAGGTAFASPSATIGHTQQVLTHGVWVAGLKISDHLIKSVAVDFSMKPSKPCTLTLTHDALVLRIPAPPPATGDGKHDSDVANGNSHQGGSAENGNSRDANGNNGNVNDGSNITNNNADKVQQIAFSALREVAINPHNQHLLMITYVDGSSLFSVLVLSSQHPRALCEVVQVYKELKQRTLTSPPPKSPTIKYIQNGNWTLRSPPSSPSSSSPSTPMTTRTKENGTTPKPGDLFKNSRSIHVPSGPTAVNGVDIGDDSSEVSEIPEDVFSAADDLDEQLKVERFPVEGRADISHVAVQVAMVGHGSDGDSVTSDILQKRVAFDLKQNLKDDAASSQPPSELPGNISDTEFHNRRNYRLGVENDTTAQIPTEGSTHALRNVGQQTEPMTPALQRTRYTKKAVKTSSSNNLYKMAAERKRSGSGSNAAATSSNSAVNGSPAGAAQNGNSQIPTASVTSGASPGAQIELRNPRNTQEPARVRPMSADLSLIQRRPSPSNDPVASQRARLPTSATTVSKPIETVYTKQSRQKIKLFSQSSVEQNQPPPHHHQQQPHQPQQLFQKVYVPRNSQTVVAYRDKSGNPRASLHRHSFTSSHDFDAAMLEGRLRRISTSSARRSYTRATPTSSAGSSRNSSRSNSLRIRAEAPALPNLGRVMSVPAAPPANLTHRS